MHKWKKAGILLSLLSVAEAGSSAYFYKRTMKRGMASTERTNKDGRVLTGASMRIF